MALSNNGQLLLTASDDETVKARMQRRFTLQPSASAHALLSTSLRPHHRCTCVLHSCTLTQILLPLLCDRCGTFAALSGTCPSAAALRLRDRVAPFWLWPVLRTVRLSPAQVRQARCTCGGWTTPRKLAVAHLTSLQVRAVFGRSAVQNPAVQMAASNTHAAALTHPSPGITMRRQISPGEGRVLNVQQWGPAPPLLLYATQRGGVHGMDLRMGRDVWIVPAPPRLGYLQQVCCFLSKH